LKNGQLILSRGYDYSGLGGKHILKDGEAIHGGVLGLMK
jgi:hypothetical protein